MFGLTLVATLGEMSVTCSVKVAYRHRRSESSTRNRSQAVGCWPFLGSLWKKAGRTQKTKQSALPESQDATTPLQPNNTFQPVNVYGTLADHDAIRLATRARLQAMEIDFGAPFDEDHVQQTVLPVASMAASIIQSPKEEKHLPLRLTRSEPWSPVSVPETALSPSHRDWRQFYTHVRSLRMSTEGELQLVKHNKTGKLYVIKSIEDCPEQYLPREAAILSQVLDPHANIVSLEDCFWEDETCHMVLEYCSGGDLENLCNFCSDLDQRLPGQFILHFIAEMIEVLAYLHCGDVEFLPGRHGGEGDVVRTVVDHESVLHRDIKPGNIFLRWDKVSNRYGMPQIILGDFGRSCEEEDNQDAHGTLGFAAPEVEEAWDSYIQGKPRERGVPVCSRESDLYSFGATLYNLMTCDTYVPGDDLEYAWRNSTVREWKFVLDILQDCLATYPTDRTQIDELHGMPLAIRQHLQAWYDDGGRVQDGTWPNPNWTDEQIQAMEGASSKSSFVSDAGDAPVANASVGSGCSSLWLHPSIGSNVAIPADSDDVKSVDEMVMLNLFSNERHGPESAASEYSVSDCTTPGSAKRSRFVATYDGSKLSSIGECW